MREGPSKIGLSPPHPGAFMRDEILDELHLKVGDAAEALGVRRATLSDLLKGNSALSSPNRSGRSRHGMPARYR